MMSFLTNPLIKYAMIGLGVIGPLIGGYLYISHIRSERDKWQSRALTLEEQLDDAVRANEGLIEAFDGLKDEKERIESILAIERDIAVSREHREAVVIAEIERAEDASCKLDSDIWTPVFDSVRQQAGNQDDN